MYGFFVYLPNVYSFFGISFNYLLMLFTVFAHD